MSIPNTSRRRFLVTAGAAAASASWSFGQEPAQAAAARYHRLNLQNPAAAPFLESYKKAITAMLQLPPSDARNWYRNAFIHTLDCPHGNWWFVVWHRGFTGWFERTVRELSGDPNFAFPYWDWTALPQLPDSFFNGVLDPNNPAYIASYNEFFAQLSNPMSALWNSFSTAQLQQMRNRGFRSVNDVWQAVRDSPMFFPRGRARTLTRQNPGFDATTRRAVSIGTIRSALAPTDFISFGSGKTANHSGSATQGILESQPHNNVHNNIGGFMQDLLSPTDPVFFAHHSNIDRLWDVWTRKQQRLGLPTLPTGADLPPWANEPFLFFIGPDGKPVAKNKAGDYATIGDFNYDYEPGSGEAVIPAATRPGDMNNKVWLGTLGASALNLGASARAEVMVPQAVPEAAMKEDGPAVFAKITIEPMADTKGVEFHVLVNAPEGAKQVDLDSPSFAGTFSTFGARLGGHENQPLSFLMPLTEAVQKLTEANELKPGQPLRVQVVAERKGVNLTPLQAKVSEISVGTF